MVLPGLVLAAVIAMDLLTPTWYGPFSPPLIVVVPALAAATLGIRGAAIYTALCVAVSAALFVGGVPNMVPPAQGGISLPGGTRLGIFGAEVLALLAIFALGFIPGVLRSRRERTIKRLRSVAEVVQQAVLVPIPETARCLRTAAEYLAADDEARIGGDLYGLIETPYGVRIIVGDVRGKGLPAVAAANNLLGAFRAVAPLVPTLPDLADLLDEHVRRYQRSTGRDTEEFTTATLVCIPPGPHAEVLSCGHPGPVLLQDGKATDVTATAPWTPLGLGHLAEQGPRVDTVSFNVGDSFAFYTDGVIEARDPTGRFYPLVERIAALAGTHPNPYQLVRHLIADLHHHARGRLDDDAALLITQRRTLD